MLFVSLVGGAMAPLLAAYVIEWVGWKWNFVLFGGVGVVWAIGFWWWYRDSPESHPRVNTAELNYIRDGGGCAEPAPHESVPWNRVRTDIAIWLLSGIIMCSSFNSYFYFTWFPTYLESAHGVSNLQSGKLTSMVLIGAAIGMLVGGVVADRIAASTRSRGLRQTFCSLGFLLAALFLYMAVNADTAVRLSQLAACSCFCVQLTLPSWWSAAIEQSGRHVGPLFGLMNMMGTVGALSSQWFVGAFADFQRARGLSGREQWDAMFTVYVVVLILGSVGWACYRFTRIHPDIAGKV